MRMTRVNSRHIEDVTPYCRLRIDKEGRWFYEDSEIVHPAIYEYFNRCLSRDDSGRYIIRTEDQMCAVEVEDAPFVVKKVIREQLSPDEPVAFIIFLNDGTREPLALDSLWVGAQNVLYCRVKGGMFHARFLRPAYYQLAEFVEHEEESGQFYILQGEVRHYISIQSFPQDKLLVK
jgi:hypothetical protein